MQGFEQRLNEISQLWCFSTFSHTNFNVWLLLEAENVLIFEKFLIFDKPPVVWRTLQIWRVSVSNIGCRTVVTPSFQHANLTLCLFKSDCALVKSRPKSSDVRTLSFS